ncbi:hypothetical protein TNCT_377021 [Trichonephila clavata]|uniref:Uncharacterized protein n=1 Tax=Trichonephila clavata TaxID=2740835 RepID=A0A8X6K9C0_TRICU|nr:hypothetical protein TNCT_377021 [Trichonephila clavata]
MRKSSSFAYGSHDLSNSNNFLPGTRINSLAITVPNARQTFISNSCYHSSCERCSLSSPLPKQPPPVQFTVYVEAVLLLVMGIVIVRFTWEMRYTSKPVCASPMNTSSPCFEAESENFFPFSGKHRRFGF